MIGTINKICAQLPPGWMIKLCMEGGAGAWVNLVDPEGRYLSLPDFGDETIAEKINAALCMAREKART